MPPVKNLCIMTSYGGIIRIRLKGRSSITSSQPANTSSPVFIPSIILPLFFKKFKRFSEKWKKNLITFLFRCLFRRNIRKLAAISNSKRGNQKRMNRLIDRKLQALLKYRRKFAKHGRTTYNINSRNIISFDKLFCY